MAVRVVVIGLCAVPLAAGYADARSVSPSHSPTATSPAPPPVAPRPAPGRFSPAGKPAPVASVPPAAQPLPPSRIAPGGKPPFVGRPPRGGLPSKGESQPAGQPAAEAPAGAQATPQATSTGQGTAAAEPAFGKPSRFPHASHGRRSQGGAASSSSGLAGNGSSDRSSTRHRNQSSSGSVSETAKTSKEPAKTTKEPAKTTKEPAQTTKEPAQTTKSSSGTSGTPTTPIEAGSSGSSSSSSATIASNAATASDASPTAATATTATTTAAAVGASSVGEALGPQVAKSAVQPSRHAGGASGARVPVVSASSPISGNLVAAQTAAVGSAPIALRAARAPASHTAPAHASSNPLANLGGQIPLPIPVPDWSKPIILALLALAGWFGIRSVLEARRARRLERQRAALLSDVGAMQAALVPKVPAALGGLAVSVAYRPAEGPAAGGDFYDVFAPEPGKVAMMLGDVAGHGHDALTQAALTRYTLRAYLQAGLEPRAALALAGRVLVDPVGERFATVAVGVYDTDSSTLTYALAGHPPPIVAGLDAPEPLTVCSSPPIGWGVPTGHRQTTISLPAGAAACFFSDGLIEARSKGELLGRERLSGLLDDLGSAPQASDLLERVRAAAEGAPDDMVACVLSPESAAAAGAVHVEELEADAQTLRKSDVRRFLTECRVPGPEIARVIARAQSIAGDTGSALLRVELAAAGSTVTAAPARSGALRTRTPDGAQAEGEPLLEALVAG
jgi:hypothetical protein